MCAGIGWKFYDEQFRMRIAKNPNASWGVVDQELWIMYMVPSANPVQKPLTRGRFLKCYDFNNYGVCVKQQCQYLHKCLSCSGPHPTVMCVGSSNYQPVARDFSGHRSPSPYRSQVPSPRPAQPHRARFPTVPRAAEPRFSPINVQVLATYFQNSDYDKRSAEFLIWGFVEGFKFNYTGPRVATNCSNL